MILTDEQSSVAVTIPLKSGNTPIPVLLTVCVAGQLTIGLCVSETVVATLAVEVHILLSVTVTVNVPELLTVMTCALAPVLQAKLPPDGMAVRLVLVPGQNDNPLELVILACVALWMVNESVWVPQPDTKA